MNYKIKVESKAESKEAQDLFVVLGYMVVNNIDCEKGYIVASKNAESPINFDYWHDVKNIITIQELRDLVVLKRNSIDDATHKNNFYCYIELRDGWYYFDMEVRKWLKSISGKPEYYGKLKPIEKREMKEYLRKNNDGEYILEVTDEREAQEPHAKHWIEVPKGCDYLISVFGANSFIGSDMFAKVKPKNVLWSRKPMKEYLEKQEDGSYKLVMRGDACKSDDIEVPEGAESFNYFNDKDNLFFLMGGGEEAMFSNELNDWDWKYWGDIGFDGVICLWQREPIDKNEQVLKEILEGGGSAWDTQVGGDHYKKYKIQPMEFALKNNLNPLQHSVLKYVMRHEDKNGKQDLEKAKHYIDLMIEYYYGDS